MRNQILIITAVLIIFGSSGCSSLNKSAAEKMRKNMHMHMIATPKKLDQNYFKNLSFEGITSIEKINVQYQSGLSEQADCIANQFDQLLDRVEERVGVDVQFNDINLKLIRTEVIPKAFMFCVPVDSNSITLPLWVEMGDESCQSILSRQSVYPSMIIHEIFEISLVSPASGTSVLMDFQWSINGLIKGNMLNYTRWFREGFANYASFIASQITAKDDNLIASDKDWRYANYMHTRPFSDLARIGTKLFKWDQFHNETKNYNAALGLFLLIRKEHGEQGIRNIARRIKEMDNVNGKDLIKLTDQELGIDIVKRVEEFTFPVFGMKSKRLAPVISMNEELDIDSGLFISSVDPNSLSDQAKLKKGDVIIRVQDKDVSSIFSFEMALLDHLHRDIAAITIWRKEEGQLQLKLPLKPASE